MVSRSANLGGAKRRALSKNVIQQQLNELEKDAGN
jgi:hypothetical protein